MQYAKFFILYHTTLFLPVLEGKLPLKLTPFPIATPILSLIYWFFFRPVYGTMGLGRLRQRHGGPTQGTTNWRQRCIQVDEFNHFCIFYSLDQNIYFVMPPALPLHNFAESIGLLFHIPLPYSCLYWHTHNKYSPTALCECIEKCLMVTWASIGIACNAYLACATTGWGTCTYAPNIN